MTMTQDNIRQHYEQNWRQTLETASGVADLAYSNPVEDAVMYPIYESLVRDNGMRVDGGSVLDVGSGSGRWARFFLNRFRPARFVGIDFAASSVELLRKWHPVHGGCAPEFVTADITEPGLRLGGAFDFINVANVLFHIPEQDRFEAAFANLAGHLAPGGRIVTTEYMPRSSRRTKWTMVRNRYEFAEAAGRAGLRVVDVRATGFFANDPLGLDGPDLGVRGRFNAVRKRMESLWGTCTNDETRLFVLEFFVEVERAAMAYCEERVAPLDFPSQKLVVLARAGAAV